MILNSTLLDTGSLVQITLVDIPTYNRDFGPLDADFDIFANDVIAIARGRDQALDHFAVIEQQHAFARCERHAIGTKGHEANCGDA